MNSGRTLRQLPIALVVMTAGIGIAQSATTGRVFPYVGYLEENGFPVDGERDIKINLYASSGAGTACQTRYFDAVTVANGRFKVDVEDVVDNCLIGGELYAGVAVGPVGGTLTDLTTGEGTGRVMIGAVPFAAASPKAATLLVEQDADIGGGLAVAGDATFEKTLTAGGAVSAARFAWGTSGLYGDHGGSIELGGSGTPYIDFHNDTTTDFDARIRLTGDDVLRVEGASLEVANRGITANGDVDAGGNRLRGKMLGTATASLSPNATYSASSDGFVSVYISLIDDSNTRCGTNARASGSVGGTPIVAASVSAHCANVDYPNIWDGFTMPVRSGETYRVDYVANGAAGLNPIAIRWTPLGN